MRRLLLITIFFLFSSICTFAQRPIYITLDVSPSMFGMKYDLANYGAQVIAILNEDRPVFLVVNAKLTNLSDGYTEIQKKVNKLGTPYNSEIVDISKLNEVIDITIPEQDVFIIGDGEWLKNEDVYDDFEDIHRSGNVRIIFLQVINQTYYTPSFETYILERKIGKMYKVKSVEDIVASIEKITEEITGVSAIPSSELKVLDDCVTFSPIIGVSSLKLLYQDKTTLNKLPQVTSVRVDGKPVRFKNIGNPSNETFESNEGGLISSGIYECTAKIPANAIVEICFDKKINVKNLKIYPIINIGLHDIKLVVESGAVKQIDANTIGVCEEDTEAEVLVSFDHGDALLDQEEMENAIVYVISNGKEYEAKYIGEGVFSATIPLKETNTYYTIQGEMKGYFNYQSGQKKIVKTKDCTPPMPPQPPAPKVRELEDMYLGEITLSKLMREGRVIITIVDAETQESLDPQYFDIKVKNNYPMLFKSVEIEYISDNRFELIIEPRGQWCDCFIPDQLKIDFFAEAKEGQLIDGKQYESIKSLMILDVVKEDSWFARCKWLVISILGSLLLAWILIKLARKHRFRKGSRIEFQYPDLSSRRSLNPKYISTDFLLRKKGFGAWLNRWLYPFGPEKSTLTFSNINLTMQFSSTKTIRAIDFPKASFNESTMESANYDADSKSNFVQLDESNNLKVVYQRQQLGKTNNFLSYVYPKKSWNDITTYRLFLGIVIFGLFLYSFVALILIIRSLF